MVRQSSGELAAAYIRRLIFDGELRPGERVPQDQVAETLGISRIPVREALIALEREGWVRIELHRGAFINAIDEQSVRDHYELYGLIYGFAAQRAVARHDDELVAKLAAIDKGIQECTDPVELGRLSIDFHNTVIEAAHSPRVKVLLRAMSVLVPGSFFAEVDGAVPLQQKGTAAIVRAFRRSDGPRAATEYQRVMHALGERVVETFKARKLFAAPTTAA